MSYRMQPQNVVVVEPKSKVLLMTTIRNWKIDPDDPSVDPKTRANFHQRVKDTKNRLLREFKKKPKTFRKLALPDPKTMRKMVDEAMFAEFPGPPLPNAQTTVEPVEDDDSGGIEIGVGSSDPPIRKRIASAFDGKDASANFVAPAIYVLPT